MSTLDNQGGGYRAILLFLFVFLVAGIATASASELSIVDSISSTADLEGARDVFVLGDYAYVASSISYSLTVVDVSNPSSISIVDSISSTADLLSANGVFVLGDYAYVASYFSDSLTVVDVSSFIVNNFTINSIDSYDNTYLSNFSADVTYEGETISYDSEDESIITDINGTGFANVTLYKDDYFNNTYENWNVSEPLEANLTPYTAIYAEFIGNDSTIEDFTVTLDGEEYESSGNVSYIPLFNETSNVTLNASGYALDTQELTADPYLQNYTFELYIQNSFNITFFNESTNSILDNSTIDIEFISDSTAFNVSTTNGTYYVDLLTPDSYTIKYNIEGSEVIRDYFTTLNPQSFQELDLYLIDEDISAYYVPEAVDSSSNACQANTISLLRYYVTPNDYKVVEMTRTNSQGQGVLRVKPNNVDYKLLFDGSCGTFTSAPTRIIDTTNTYTITGGQSVLESVQAISDASTSLTYNNATETFVYTWTSTSNVITEGCLEVVKRKNGVRNNFATTCSYGNTGSVFVTINDTNQSTFFASGRLYTGTEFSDETTNNLEISFLGGFFELQNYSPFIALIAFIAIMLFVGVSATSLVIGAVASLAILSTFQLVNIGAGTLITFFVIGGAILYRIAGRT